MNKTTLPMRTKTLVIVTSLAVCPSVPANATENLVVNGDAEIGTMEGWETTGVEIIAAEGVVYYDGLPSPGVIGEFCFVGLSGATQETASQTIHIGQAAAVIDAGNMPCEMSGWLQSRKFGNLMDLVDVEYEFLDENGLAMDSQVFVDPTIGSGIYNWDYYNVEMIVPPSTRSVRITVSIVRNGGIQSDAFADNLSFVLSVEPCFTDLNGDGATDIDDFLILLAFWGPCEIICLGDLDNDGTVGITDFLTLLASWGACT
jgi:hypothetical protein